MSLIRTLQEIEHAAARRALHIQTVTDIRREVELATIEAATDGRDFEVLLHHPKDEERALAHPFGLH